MATQSWSGNVVLRAVAGLVVVAGLAGLLVWWNPSGLYLWLKAVHVIAVIAWMAGMLVLPRLFAYDAEQNAKPEPLRGEMQALLREDCPWLFLYHRRNVAQTQARLRNFQMHDFPYGMEKYLRHR